MPEPSRADPGRAGLVPVSVLVLVLVLAPVLVPLPP